FEGNTLTHDLREWNTLRRQVVSHPEFGLGGPSVNWVDLALRDGDALAELDAPDVPALAVYAGNEKIVRNDRIEAITAKWPKAKAYRVEGAEHEVLMESSEMRRQVWDQVTAFLDSHTA
ncbi:MAG: alpha/beta hydrolase, partial [Pseudomonadota bacterium]